MTTIVLVDDSRLITSGLKIILESEPTFTVLGTFDDATAAINFCTTHEVDIALMDVRMPGMTGVAATKLITTQTATRVIILTTFDEDEYIVTGIQNGASGYLLKTTDADQLLAAIKMVAQGQSILSPAVLRKAAASLTTATISPDLRDLTEREQEITRLVAKGLTNKQIAAQLFLSDGTVNNSLSTILHKLDLDHRTQLAIYYLTGEGGQG
ncbi:response regulator [Levilactobacillus koreensis]|uniref:LuxR family transcriptional regulator n=1 Tax=Levilactobacillus koreensis TaxID=637971 RepID=A0AAC8UWT9_9LACO|nr:response regulator transcription factor [Levilactobacillus koreensis]AKP65870.1 LuxR family transcriptional regulator [Levilactobacillus koreensis]